MSHRAALTIGLNQYPGTSSDLLGCVNDALDWADCLHNRSFDTVNTILDSDATGANIRQAIGDYVTRAKYGDLLVFTYSGHGTWLPDQSGDEPDRRDEALCPYDIFTVGPILDDELHTMFSRRAFGVRIVFISDSCHSGSVLRFAAPITDDNRKIRYLPAGVFLPPEQTTAARGLHRIIAGHSRSTALLLSGCRDMEYSYDASFGGRPNGAFTRVAIDTLDTRPPTYREWMSRINAVLPSQDFPQTPGLNGTFGQRSWATL